MSGSDYFRDYNTSTYASSNSSAHSGSAGCTCTGLCQGLCQQSRAQNPGYQPVPQNTNSQYGQQNQVNERVIGVQRDVSRQDRAAHMKIAEHRANEYAHGAIPAYGTTHGYYSSSSSTEAGPSTHPVLPQGQHPQSDYSSPDPMSAGYNQYAQGYHPQTPMQAGFHTQSYEGKGKGVAPPQGDPSRAPLLPQQSYESGYSGSVSSSGGDGQGKRKHKKSRSSK